MKPNSDENAMRRTHVAVGLVGVSLALAAWFWGGRALALGTAVGATVAALNLWVLARTVRNLLSGLSMSWGAVAAGKFLILMAVTYLALNSSFLSPLGFALGVGALPLGIVIAGLIAHGDPAINPAEANEINPSMGASSTEIDHA
jgi:hypothetical protein